MKESLKLAVEKAKRGESEGFGTIYRETCADVYFREIIFVESEL